MEGSVYIRLRHRLQVRPESSILLENTAQIIAPEHYLQSIRKIVLHKVTEEDKNIIILDLMRVISQIKAVLPNVDVQTIGPSQTIVEVVYKRKKVSPPMFAAVWLLLFIGAAMAIMNFHEDVSMREVHQRLYLMMTGHEDPHPLLFQVPYSFGLGLGMILFFNHVFRKRINEEPSPLEVEMFNYQQDLDQYVIMHENKESMKHLDDH
ncbi:stage V sporulation protein AA [Rossellomorea vietnamensis]|uniref:Stage V sporulation protein AA n=2 Tax=Rossellomorea TaxID=2837508 RepID=A0A5D4KGK0_9BACI|nr:MULTISPECIES: stage V sporulation protein AA [Rossellomorea]TYR76398.1 stage V sporulation protein AA [Rossellomorea vietnamensis]TYS76334.1 stage V sporulation protein AA [Rossellomorea aquimaris]